MDDEFMLNDEERAFVSALMERMRLPAKRRMAQKLGAFRNAALEDCEAELWLLVCIEAKRLMKHENPDGWVSVAAVNIALNCVKMQIRKERLAHSDEGLLDEAASDEMPVDERVVNDLLFERWEKENFKAKLLSLLTSKEKELYDLRYVEKKSFEEISAKTGRSQEAVQMALSRIRKKIISEIRHYRC